MHQDIIVAIRDSYTGDFPTILDETPYRIEEELVKIISVSCVPDLQDDELFRKIICMISDVLSGKIKEYILPEM